MPRPIELPARKSSAYRRVAERGATSFAEHHDAVQAIVDRVRAEGDAALIADAARFDRVTLEALEVSADDRAAAAGTVAPEVREALERAGANIRAFHEAQRPSRAELRLAGGGAVWQEFRPFARAGLYAPGGRARYPSTVLMTGIPARVAGVREVVLCTPPAPDGTLAPGLAAAAEVAGVDHVFMAGGAGAIAAMAYGTESVPVCQAIVGPGNAYVATAKQLVRDRVAIDSPAGPSEVLIVADESAVPAYVAADLLAQCEHGPDSIALLVATSRALADAVADACAALLPGLARAPIVREAWETHGAIWITPDLTVALAVATELAFEHVGLCVAEPRAALARLGAGASVFLGNFAPIAAGDYASGTNHVLPTGGAARRDSALALRDFGVMVEVQELDRAALAELAPTIRTLAESEGLDAHRKSVDIRLHNQQPTTSN